MSRTDLAPAVTRRPLELSEEELRSLSGLATAVASMQAELQRLRESLPRMEAEVARADGRFSGRVEQILEARGIDSQAAAFQAHFDAQTERLTISYMGPPGEDGE